MKTPDVIKLGEIVDIAISKAKKHKQTSTFINVAKYSDSAQLHVAYELQRGGSRVYFQRNRDNQLNMYVTWEGER